MSKKILKFIAGVASTAICVTSMASYASAEDGSSFSNNQATYSGVSESDIKTYGDINGDGVIDSKDAVNILIFYANKIVDSSITMSQFLNDNSKESLGDVNRDGSVNSADAVEILVYYANTLVKSSAIKVDYLSAYGEIVYEADNLSKGEQNRYYTLYDIDRDGYKELITKMGSYADVLYEVWKIENENEVVFCGMLDAWSSWLEEKNQRLYILGGHTNYEWINEVSLKGEILSETEIYGKEVNDYFSYGTKVGMYDFSDLSLLAYSSTVTPGSISYKYIQSCED